MQKVVNFFHDSHCYKWDFFYSPQALYEFMKICNLLDVFWKKAQNEHVQMISELVCDNSLQSHCILANKPSRTLETCVMYLMMERNLTFECY